MIKYIAYLLIIFFPLNGTTQNFGGNPPSVKWQQVNNDKARVIFPKGLDSQANYIATEMSIADCNEKPERKPE